MKLGMLETAMDQTGCSGLAVILPRCFRGRSAMLTKRGQNELNRITERIFRHGGRQQEETNLISQAIQGNTRPTPFMF